MVSARGRSHYLAISLWPPPTISRIAQNSTRPHRPHPGDGEEQRNEATALHHPDRHGLYDNAVKLVASAAAEPTRSAASATATGAGVQAALASRLIEMRSGLSGAAAWSGATLAGEPAADSS